MLKSVYWRFWCPRQMTHKLIALPLAHARGVVTRSELALLAHSLYGCSVRAVLQRNRAFCAGVGSLPVTPPPHAQTDNCNFSIFIPATGGRSTRPVGGAKCVTHSWMAVAVPSSIIMAGSKSAIMKSLSSKLTQLRGKNDQPIIHIYLEQPHPSSTHFIKENVVGK